MNYQHDLASLIKDYKMIFHVVLNFECVNKFLKYNHSNERSYWSLLSHSVAFQLEIKLQKICQICSFEICTVYFCSSYEVKGSRLRWYFIVLTQLMVIFGFFLTVILEEIISHSMGLHCNIDTTSNRKSSQKLTLYFHNLHVDPPCVS